MSHLTIRKIMLVAALFVAGCTAGCDNKQTGATKKPAELKTVTLAASKNLWTSVALVAKAKGYFEQEGLDVQVAFQDGGRYCMDALVSNSADFATVVEVNMAYLGYAGNENVSVISSIVESSSTRIIGSRKAGIAGPADLKGKILGYSPGTGSEIYALKFLEYFQIPKDSVDLRKLQPKAIQAALVAGEVDAICTWDPFIENVRRAMGDDAVVMHEPQVYVGHMYIAVRKDWAAANRGTVEAFVRGLNRAARLIQQDPAQAQPLIAAETAIAPDLVAALWEYFDFGVSLDPARDLAAIEKVGHFITGNVEAYLGKPVPNYSGQLDPSFLTNAPR